MKIRTFFPLVRSLSVGLGGWGLLISLTGCSVTVETDNVSPKLYEVIEDLAVPLGDTLEITLAHVMSYDKNGDDMTLVVIDSTSYSVVPGTTKIVPDSGVVGDILVYLQVRDEEGKLSDVHSILVSVLPNGRQVLIPLYTGAEWNYLDTFHTLNEVDTSHLKVMGPYSGSVPGVATPVFRLRWSGLSGYTTAYDTTGSDTVEYLLTDTDSGVVVAGGQSTYDTYLAPHLFLQYPVASGDSWSYASLEYNLELKRFFTDTTVDSMVVKGTDVYTRVPAGVFNCIHYQYNFSQFLKSRSNIVSVRVENRDIPVSVSKGRADTTVTVTVNLYYSPGVGYVKNETYVGAKKVYTKSLNSYTVEEL